MTMLNVIGLMSGTSMDGVDVALLRTDGERILDRGPHLARPYTPKRREVLRAALAEARTLGSRDSRPPGLARAERMVTQVHAEAISAFMRQHGLHPAAASGLNGDRSGAPSQAIDLIGFHGQTVFHAPERGLTVQIGDGSALARRLKIPVVYDLRAADVAAGGEGAPLVPVYHRALVLGAGLELPVGIVNIGGVANLTLIGPGDQLVACDTGPGNALIDDFVRQRTGRAMDEGGRLALAGSIDEAALGRLLDNSFFARPAPKSLDRDAFSIDAVARLSTENGAATLAAFTARSIAGQIASLGGVRSVIVSGGGARNPAILRALAAFVGAPVETADALGWSAEFLEAEAFAFLAARSMRSLPLTFPGTTGVPAPTTGGLLARP